ncbi:4506_t:CDS:2, partial [Cetraspora pellucida]
GEYENLILESRDLPSSLNCIVLECGFTTNQLDELLKNCKLNSLYIKYMNFKSTHFGVIAEYAITNSLCKSEKDIEDIEDINIDMHDKVSRL